MPGRAYRLSELRKPPEPEVLPWEEFEIMFAKSHKQGEHIAIEGPTGSGKTVLGLSLCKLIGARPGKDRRPSRVTVIQTKTRDDTTRAILPKEEWPEVKTWPPSYGQEHCIVWPRGGAASQKVRRQRAVLVPLLDIIHEEGGQTLYIPEAAYFERPLPKGLAMSGTMELFWSEARSNKLTVISDTQRPVQVTRLMWSEPSWLMIYRPEDDDDLKRVAELSGEKLAVWAIVPQLGGHEFLCIRRQRGGQRGLYVSRVDVTGNNRNERN